MIEERRPIRQHEYFEGIDWRAAEEGRLRPPVVPDSELPELPDKSATSLLSEEFAQRSKAAAVKLEEKIACSKTDNKMAARRFTI